MHKNQIEAYRSAQKVTLSGRELEASVLVKAAQLLKKCQDNWSSDNIFEELDNALKYNQLIWSVFQAELAEPDNPLPKKLRENILSLALFIDRKIFDIMAFPEQQKLNAIIDINLNIAAGLRTTDSAETP